jgi:H+/Cl- antiporter ClcA
MRLTRRYLRMTLRAYLSPYQWKARLVFWGGAILVGLFSAVFALGSEAASHLFGRIESQNPYLPLLITPAGLVLIAWLTRRYFPGAQGSGIPQAIAALEFSPGMHHLRSSLLSMRIAIGKVLLSLLGLLCGASIGREGPTVHIGASIMYSVGHYAHFPRHYLDKSLIVAGGAAGIAAAFNTPLAGIVFAIEEMARSFEERTSGTMLTAVVIAGITAMAILGNYTYFGSSDATLQLGTGWLVVPVVGLLGGLLGGGFARLLVGGSRWVAPHLARHPLLVPALCGLVVAIAGILSGGSVYGTGYPEAKAVITGAGEAEAAFPFLKMVATIASYLSGIPGGIFAPSLATGAGLGSVMAGFFDGPTVEAVVILTMVAYFTGVVQTPITAFVIVMEMTANHTMLLPLMATAFIAYGSSKLICHEPIYRTLAQGFIDRLRQGEPSAAEKDKPSQEPSR